MIKDIERFRELIPTVAGQSLSKYTQPIADAVGWLRQQIVGPALMNVIEAMQNEAEAPELFKRVELVVAYKAYLIAIPKMDVIETANGFAVVNDDTMAPASRDRVASLSASMTESLEQALAELIEYLEDSEEHRAAWRQSPAYQATSGSYISTLREFRQYSSFKGGYLDFISAQVNIRSVILKNIEPIISREFSNEVISQIVAGNVPENNSTILADLRYALAGFYNNDAQLGDTCLARVRETLEKSPDNYPAFRDSILYQRIVKRQNEEHKYESIYPLL